MLIRTQDARLEVTCAFKEPGRAGPFSPEVRRALWSAAALMPLCLVPEAVLAAPIGVRLP